MNTTEQTTSSIPSTTETTASPALCKPVRKSFYRDVVINAAGSIIDESVWKPLVDKAEGRAAAGALRRQGLQLVHVFDRPGYETAKKEYSVALKAAKITERDMIIFNAFHRADVKVEPHIERALKDLLPIMTSVSTNRATVALKNVVRTIANCVGMNKDPEAQTNDPQSDTTAPAAA